MLITLGIPFPKRPLQDEFQNLQFLGFNPKTWVFFLKWNWCYKLTLIDVIWTIMDEFMLYWWFLEEFPMRPMFLLLFLILTLVCVGYWLKAMNWMWCYVIHVCMMILPYVMYNFYEIRVESLNEALKAMKGICQLLILMLIMLLLHELPCIMYWLWIVW